MRLFCISDLHLMARNPGWRKDDFLLTQTRKLKFILDHLTEASDCLLSGGDFWDSPKIPYAVYAHFLPSIFGESIFTVYGQHDLRYHTRKENTPLYALSKTQTLWIPESKPLKLDNTTDLYGASWGEEVPKIKNRNKLNILLIHKMITHGGPLFPGQEGNVEAKDFLRKNSFDLVVSGDNHRTFVCRHNDQVLINPGSVCRTAIDQVDHIPKMFRYEDGKVSEIPIPIEPSVEVFDLEKALQKGEIEETAKKRVEDFLKALKQHPEQSGLNFERNLRERTKELPQKIKNILLECIREKEEVE